MVWKQYFKEKTSKTEKRELNVQEVIVNQTYYLEYRWYVHSTSHIHVGSKYTIMCGLHRYVRGCVSCGAWIVVWVVLLVYKGCLVLTNIVYSWQFFPLSLFAIVSSFFFKCSLYSWISLETLNFLLFQWYFVLVPTRMGMLIRGILIKVNGKFVPWIPIKFIPVLVGSSLNIKIDPVQNACTKRSGWGLSPQEVVPKVSRDLSCILRGGDVVAPRPSSERKNHLDSGNLTRNNVWAKTGAA